jgi:predicted DNA-binding helix-hairpin-helix protein
MREHRLYQTDWLIRKYGFTAQEIPFGSGGNLSLEADPKMVWAQQHPEKFPLNVNLADKLELLRVPGLGPISVQKILSLRSHGGRIKSLDQLGRMGKRLTVAQAFLKYD